MKAALACVVLLLTSVALSQTGPLTIVASDTAGDVVVPDGAYTDVLVRSIGAQAVTVGSGVTADSLTFQGTIAGGRLVVDGATVGSITTGAMTSGSISYTNVKCAGDITFAALSQVTKIDLSGTTTTDGSITFNGAVNGAAAVPKPNVTFAGLRAARTGTTSTNGVYFGSTVAGIGGVSFENAVIDVTTTGSNTYALAFAKAVTADELVLDGAKVTATSTGPAVHVVSFLAELQVGRITARGTTLRSRGTSNAYALRLGPAVGDSLLLQNTVIEAVATGATGATAHAGSMVSMTGFQSIVVEDSNVTAVAATGTHVLSLGHVDTVGVVTAVRCVFTASSGNGGNALALSFASISDVGDVSITDTAIEATATGKNAYAVHVTGPATRIQAFRCRNLTAVANAGTLAGALYFTTAVSHLGSFLVENSRIAAHASSTEAGKGYGARALVFYATLSNVAAFTVESTALEAGSLRSFSVSGAHALQVRGLISHVTSIAVNDVNATAQCKQSLATAAYFEGGMTNVTAVRLSHTVAEADAGTSTAYAASAAALQTVGSFVLSDVVAVATALGATARAASFTSLDDVGDLTITDSTINARSASGTHAVAGTGNVDTLRRLLLENVTVSSESVGATAHAVSWTATLTAIGEVTITNVTAKATASASAYTVSFIGSFSHSGPIELRAVTATAEAKLSSVVAFGIWLNVSSLSVSNCTLRSSGSGASKALGFGSRVKAVQFINVTDSVLEAATSAASAMALWVADASSDIGAVDIVRSTVRATAQNDGAHAIVFLNGMTNLGRFLVRESTVEATVVAGPAARAVYLSAASGTRIDLVDSAVTTTAGSGASAVFTLALTDVHLSVRRCTITADASGTADALYVTSMEGGGSLAVEGSNVTADTRASNTARAVYAGALTDVSTVRIVSSHATARSHNSVSYAVYFLSVTGTGDLTVEQVDVTARAADATAIAVSFGALSNVQTLAVQHIDVQATCRLASARAVHMGGAVSDVGTAVFRNVSASATAGTIAAGLHFGSRVSRIGSITVEDSVVSAKTTDTNVNLGHSAWALMFYSSVSNVGPITVRNVRLTADAIQSSTSFGAHVFQTRGAVSHVEKFVIEDLTAVAKSEGSLADAVVFASTMTNVSSLTIVRSTMNATATVGNAHVVQCRGALTNVDVIAISDSTAIAVSSTLAAGAGKFYDVSTGQVLSIERSSLRAHCRAGAAYAFSAGAVVSVASVSVTDSWLEAVGGSTAYAAYWTSVSDARTLHISGVNVSAQVQTTSGAYAIGGSTLTRIGHVSVVDGVALATASSTAQTVTWNAGLTNIGALLLTNVTATSIAGALSATTQAVSFPGSLSHSGPFELRDVRATAHGKSAAIMSLGVWRNVSSLLIVNSTLKATANGGSVKVVSFASRVEGLRYLNVTDSTLDADSSGAAEPAALALALYVAHTTSQVGAIDVVRSSVRAVARDSGAQAVALMNTLADVGRVLVQDSTVEAVVVAGPTAYAVYLSRASGITLEVIDSIVSATSAALTANAVYTLALENSHVRVVQTVASADSSTSALALYVTSLADGGSIVIDRLNATAVARTSNTAQALYIGALADVSAVSITQVDAEARAGTTSAYALNIVSLARVGALRVEHVRASATSGASAALAVNVGIVSSVTSVVIAHAVVVAISGVATARAVLFTGAVAGARSVLLRNITATATAETSAGALYFGGVVSSTASFVVEDVSVTAKATGTAAGTGHSVWALVFYASVFNVDTMLFRSVDLSANAAQSSVNFGAHALHVRGVFNHVPAVEMVDVTARASSDVIAMALRFEGVSANVSVVALKNIVANASTTKPSASAIACVVPSATAVTIETLNVWLRSSHVGTALTFGTTNLTLRGATVVAAAAVLSVLEFSATITAAKFVIADSSFDVDAPTVSIPKFTTVASSDVTIEDSAFNFSAATAGAADAFLRINHLRESAVTVRRCQLHAPHGNPAIFVYLVNSITSSRQSYAGVTAAKAFNSSYAPIKSQTPGGTCEVCVNNVEFLSESGAAVEYDPAPLRAQGFVVLHPGACRATMTPEPTPTIVPVLTPTATGSATITPPNTSTHTGTASMVDPPPTKTATNTHSQTPAQTPSLPPTATAAGNASNATATTPPRLTKSADVTRSNDLPRTGTVLSTPSHRMTATPVPTATVELKPRPKAVPALLAEAQVAAQVTSSVSAVVSPVSALSAQRAAALTKTCPEDPPDGTEQLSFLDNPMQQALGAGPARFHAAAVAGNMLLLIGGCLLCSFVGVGVAFASSVLPKHNHREEARNASKAAYLLCIFLQCFGGEVFLIVSLLIVTPTCSAAVVCLGHPSSDVSVEERLIGAAALLVIAIVACGVSFFTTLARRYCYCPEEPPTVQAASAVLKDRALGAPPPPWESQGDGEGSIGSDAELQASCGGKRKWAAPIAVAQRVLKAAVIGPEWELRPEMRPLPSGVAKALMLLIGDSRPGITRPHLCFLDRRGCYWFFALDLWVAILTGVGVGVLELSHCEVAGAVAGLQFLYVFIFVVSRPLRSPLLLVVTFIALVLQSAAVIVAAATSSGLFKGKPTTLEDLASGSSVLQSAGEEEEDGTADLLDAVATALALVLAIQGIVGLLVGILTRYRRRQHEARRAHDVQHREAHVLMAPLLIAEHGDFTDLDARSDKPDSIDGGLVLDFLPERQSDYTNTPGARQSVTGGFGRGASPQRLVADESDIDDIFREATRPERQRDQGLGHPAPPEQPDRPSNSGGALGVTQDTPVGSDHASFVSLSGMLSPADAVLDALPQLPPASTGTPLMMTPNVRPSASPFDAPLPPARPPQQFMSPLSSLAAQRGPSNPLQSAFVPSAPRARAAAVKESTERMPSDVDSDDPTDVIDRLLRRQSASPYSSPKTAPSNPLDLDDF